jgi:hypothetical protein
MIERKALLFAGLFALATAGHAQPANPKNAAERDLFARIVEIPTVEGQPAEFKKLTSLLTAEFRKAGITNVVVKNHDNTQTLIARWPAAKPSGKKPILLMAHMDVVAAKQAIGNIRRSSSAKKAAIIWGVVRMIIRLR